MYITKFFWKKEQAALKQNFDVNNAKNIFFLD